MCLGIPGQLKEIYEANGAKMGKVNFGGIVKEVCLEDAPELQVGEYTIVHVGFALTRIETSKARWKRWACLGKWACWKKN